MDNNDIDSPILVDDFYCSMEENPLHKNSSTQTSQKGSNQQKIKYKNSDICNYCYSWKWMFFNHDTFIDYKNHHNISDDRKLICCSFYPQCCEFLVARSCFSNYVECCCFTFLPFQ